MNKANAWLRTNNYYAVSGCETISVTPEHEIVRGSIVSTQPTNYYVHVTTRHQHNSNGGSRHETVLSITTIKCLRYKI